MTQRTSWLGAAVLLLSACASSGSGSATTAEAAPAAPESTAAPTALADASAVVDEEEDDEELRCTFVAVTGSHLKRRVCTTAAQREAMRRESHNYLRSFYRAGVIDERDRASPRGATTQNPLGRVRQR